MWLLGYKATRGMQQCIKGSDVVQPDRSANYQLVPNDNKTVLSDSVQQTNKFTLWQLY